MSFGKSSLGGHSQLVTDRARMIWQHEIRNQTKHKTDHLPRQDLKWVTVGRLGKRKAPAARWMPNLELKQAQGSLTPSFRRDICIQAIRSSSHERSKCFLMLMRPTVSPDRAPRSGLDSRHAGAFVNNRQITVHITRGNNPLDYITPSTFMPNKNQSHGERSMATEWDGVSSD